MPSLINPAGQGASGVVSLPVIGIVTDNVDPDGLGRIKVKFPNLHGGPESFWLRQASPNGGKERGFYALPEKEDEVLVIFLQGSQDTGVIIGQMWNGQDKPPAEAKTPPTSSKSKVDGAGLSSAVFTDGSTDISKNDRRFWNSRSGHLFIFDDTDGKESVTIWDKSLKLCFAMDSSTGMISLSNNQGDIHIRAKGDIVMEAVGNIKYKAGVNIEGESVADTKLKVGANQTVDVTQDSTNTATGKWSISATQAFEATGLTAKMSGNSTAEVSSPSTTLSGTGSCKVSGGVVMIN